MKIRQNALYEQFQCAGGACPDTCCGGWNIDIDEEALDYYQSLRGSFGQQVRRAVNWQEACFVQTGGHCRMQNAEGLCELQVRYGEDALCETCRRYPRHCEEYPGLLDYSVGLSCPEAVRLLLTLEDPLRETETEAMAGEELTEWSEEELEDFDEELFAWLREKKEELLAILQKKELSLEERVYAYLQLASLLQRTWDEREEGAVRPDDSALSQAVCQKQALHRLPSKTDCYEWKAAGFEVLWNLDPVRNSWNKQLKDLRTRLFREEVLYQQQKALFRQALSEDQAAETLFSTAVERIVHYSLELYLYGASYDGWIFSRAGLGVFFASVLEDLLILDHAMTGALPTIEKICLYLCALLRETEHRDDNLNQLIVFLDESFTD